MADTSVFGRLKRLFNKDIIIRNVGGKQLKVMDVDAFQAYGSVRTNALIDKYTKMHKFGSASYGNQAMTFQGLRVQLYTDYEAMDTESIIASALDVISDESTLKNETGEILQIRSSDENIQKILYNLFYDILNIEFNLWTWTRQMCKYGDFYLHLQIAEQLGIYNVIPMSSYEMVREEGYDPEKPSAVRFRSDPSLSSGLAMGQVQSTAKTEFDNYEIAHFRLLTDSNYLPYGRAFIEPARKTYKQYSMMKDAMLLQRIMRAPDKRVHYINVGNIPPNEIDAFMQKIMQNMKKTPHIDQNTGEYNLRFNVQNMMEDYYIPMRGNDTTTKIDTLPGLTWNGIDDVNFLRDEMLAALKVPKAFFGFEKDLQGKATLAAEDIRFARTVERIQRIMLSELYKIALVHLYVQGYDDSSLTNFELTLTVPSIVYEQEKIALFKEKTDLSKQLVDSGLFSSDWIYHNIWQFSEDIYEDVRDQVIEDKKRAFRLAQIENEGNDPAKTGKSFGTPHDLASLYGKGRSGQDDVGIPDEYNEKVVKGRPIEKMSMINTQQDPLGKDRFGRAAMNTPGIDKMANDSDSNTFKTGSPLALSELYKNRNLLKAMREKLSNQKQSLFEDKQESGMLDEQNLKGI